MGRNSRLIRHMFNSCWVPGKNAFAGRFQQSSSDMDTIALTILYGRQNFNVTHYLEFAKNRG
jgi:hypothetical protein